MGPRVRPCQPGTLSRLRTRRSWGFKKNNSNNKRWLLRYYQLVKSSIICSDGRDNEEQKRVSGNLEIWMPCSFFEITWHENLFFLQRDRRRKKSQKNCLIVKWKPFYHLIFFQFKFSSLSLYLSLSLTCFCSLFQANTYTHILAFSSYLYLSRSAILLFSSNSLFSTFLNVLILSHSLSLSLSLPPPLISEFGYMGAFEIFSDNYFQKEFWKEPI